MKTTPRKSASPPNQANNFTPTNASQLNGGAGGGAGGNGWRKRRRSARNRRERTSPRPGLAAASPAVALPPAAKPLSQPFQMLAELAALKFPFKRSDSLVNASIV